MYVCYMKHEDKCPVCNGSGRFETPKHQEADLTEVKREMAIKLNDKGYSRRQIQRALGYKSVRSVQYLLGKK